MQTKQLYLSPHTEIINITPEAFVCASFNNSAFENGQARDAEDDDYYWN